MLRRTPFSMRDRLASQSFRNRMSAPEEQLSKEEAEKIIDECMKDLSNLSDKFKKQISEAISRMDPRLGKAIEAFKGPSKHSKDIHTYLEKGLRREVEGVLLYAEGELNMLHFGGDKMYQYKGRL